MKQILFSFLTIAAVSANAQSVVYFEDFNKATTTTPPAGWVFEDMDGDGYNFGDMYFVPDTAGQPSTPISLISRSWQVAPLTPDNAATSPLIDLTKVSGPIKLEWKVTAANNTAWNSENYSVYVHTLEDVYEAVLETPVFTETYKGAGGIPGVQTKSVDISAFAGKSVFVTFRHHNVTDMDYISLDDVKVTGETLGVSDLNQAKVSIYPNPVQDEFKLNLSQSYNSSKVQVTVTDLTGKKVKSFSGNETYNISELNKGIYILTVTDGVNKFTQKIIKK
ncbi:Por secretion system C-terminal sorting domain-containing protein [Algoriella xinjiangensis]|uniref:Por secretion system C-terminal sorting domain-containing protein n=1 Tax=Algoriella xinjiangensis TaxID=684065 RepID=A0A1I4UPY0_9FLAO|nr:T9SS type A sorting domain-containing protein [Algoriella xinjiangensis]SFM90991.1 Por secretion system C-terminal sorting domain-containing protein [Algoriella xinjiangensis]VDH18255.1 Hemagglutinin A precursor [Algoriella xinjiangensis]